MMFNCLSVENTYLGSLNHNKTSLKTTLSTSLFFFPSFMIANLRDSGFPTRDPLDFSQIPTFFSVLPEKTAIELKKMSVPTL